VTDLLLTDEEIEFARARRDDLNEFVDFPLEWDGGIEVEEELDEYAGEATVYRYVYVSECSYLGDTTVMNADANEWAARGHNGEAERALEAIPEFFPDAYAVEPEVSYDPETGDANYRIEIFVSDPIPSKSTDEDWEDDLLREMASEKSEAHQQLLEHLES